MPSSTSPVCNFCHSTQAHPLLVNVGGFETKDTFTYYQCWRCDLVFLHPQPSVKKLATYYPADHYWGRKDATFSHEEIVQLRQKSYTHIYSFIEKKFKKGAVLDVGAGTGLLLSHFAESGWEVFGTETSKSAIALAKKNHSISLYKGDLLSLSIHKKFDIVILHHVLEHLSQPSETVAFINSLLKKGGYLIISVPNIQSFGATWFGADWYALQPPTHLFHFSPSVLKELLYTNRFSVLKIDHGHMKYNFYCFFESMRRRFTDNKEFSQKKTKEKKEEIQKSTIASMLKKGVAYIFAFFVVLLERLFQKAEIITVYGQKKN